MNANYGNKGLLNYTPTTDVYVHTGVVTNKSTSANLWQHVRTVWATTYAWERATYIGNNQWTFTIDTTGGLRKFYGITDTSEHIQKIAILFRNGAGTSAQRNQSGDDMFIPVYGTALAVRIDNPFRQPEYTPINETIIKTVGSALSIVGKSSLTGSTIKLYFNGKLLSSLKAVKDSISTTITAAGTQTIVARASKKGSTTISDTLKFYVATPNVIAALPAGVTDGINYFNKDSVTLVLFAPNKGKIIVLGDFNNWTASPTYQMNETPDLQRFWLTIKGLKTGTEYAYQYQIDDSLQVADYNTQKVLDKHVDSMISGTTYPNLKAFPPLATGNLASSFQLGQAPYKWKVTNFTRPDKRNLVIYELLMRDFTAAANWQTVQDTLTYLKRLGVNAIEILPFCNFEGYSSWGYNPNFYFAPDKVYGTPANLKAFVDACHQDSIAVIMDLAMQDVYGSSPLASMYWNSFASVPATNNPWLDQYPTHAYNDGSQFNHSSAATIALRKRVYAYWLDSFKLDGFRFDLAGGYTQTNTCGANGTNCNVTEWNYYDQNRVNTLDSVYAEQQAISPGSYSIWEIFVATSEEANYVNNGQLVWSVGDQNSAFTQASMGYPTTNGDFSGGLYTNTSGWTQPGEVTYMESHDETATGDERVMFKNENYGNVSGSYSAKDTATALKRTGMAAAFWAMMPGPKMMWQFEELGYDYSPNACSNGAVTCGNTDPKPIRWDYKTQTNRAALFNVYSKLLNLRKTAAYLPTFTTGSTNKDLSSYIKWMSVYSTSLQVMVYGNFDVAQQTGNISFPSTGTWYNLFTGATISVTTTNLQSVTLQPGEYYVYINQKPSTLVAPENPLTFEQPAVTAASLWKVYPNPARGNTYFHAQSNLGKVQMQLMDMSGRVLYNHTSANMQNGSQEAIPVSGLSHGMYFLRINSEKASGTEKIVVQ
jgi:1,4-alpha-glucan branching enzyme